MESRLRGGLPGAGDRSPEDPARACLEERLRGTLQGTILTEHWRVVFRRTYVTRLEQLERSLQHYLRFYNTERTHRGYRLRGRIPGSIFRSAR